jgi:hypothetical protein
MKGIIFIIKDYFLWINRRVLVIATLFTAILVFLNYYSGINSRISIQPDHVQWLYWYVIFFGGFSFTYLLPLFFLKENYFNKPAFLMLVFLAPAIFAWKMSYGFSFYFTGDLILNAYWNTIIYWPLKCIIVGFCLWILWMILQRPANMFGLSAKGFNPTPYLWMLVIMIPLIFLASLQNDFLAMYPRLQNIDYLASSNGLPWYKLLFEFSYGIDFLTIEVFFRGFLVIGFAKYAGRHAILPMAVFYCMIHFGKPLGECISSFFGGLILGVITYHTRTIYGGLIVHLGIAWMMELGGWIGNELK